MQRIKDEVVIEDNRALRLLRKEQFAHIPELRELRRTITDKPVCCGETTNAEREAIQRLKESLQNFSPESLRQIKELMHTRQLRVLYRRMGLVHEVVL